jgi:CheY-like chemotaxis protein
VATVLVVEDETEARRAIAQVLSAAGHTVIEAVDGRDGLDRFERHRPRLILCDVLMPERDGLQVIAALRGDGIGVPIVAMVEPAAADAKVLMDLALTLGADGVLLKPVLVSELLKITGRFLATKLPNLRPGEV